MKWNDRQIVANYVRIHFWANEAENGSALVFSHGITDNGMCWERLASAVDEERGSTDRMYLLDARGHGESEIPRRPYTWADLASDITGFIKVMSLKKAVLFGHSMGATSSAIAAMQCPDLVGSLVLEDPPWRYTEASPDPQVRRIELNRWRADIRKHQRQTPDEMLLAHHRKAKGRPWHERELKPWVKSKHQVDPDIVYLMESHAPSFEEQAAGITCPTLLITGDPKLGAIITEEVSEAVKEINPLIQVVKIAGAGHCVHRDRFVEALDAITSFLREVA
jgi:pimeloyl-ACP methyl ester carboxylesterase